MMKKTIIFVFVFVLCLSHYSFAACPGGVCEVGEEKSYSTIQSAVDTVACGDDIKIYEGVYSESITKDPVPACESNPWKIRPVTSGVVIDVPGTQESNCSAFIFKGTGLHNGRGGIIVGDTTGTYQMEIRNIGYSGLAGTSGDVCSAVFSYYADSITVSNLLLTSAVDGPQIGGLLPSGMGYYSTTSFIHLEYGDNHEVVDNIANVPTWGLTHGLYAHCDNWTHNNDRGVHFEGNKIIGASATGLLISKCENNIVERNYFQSDKILTGSYLSACLTHYKDCSRVWNIRNSSNYKIRNNIIKASGGPYWWGVILRGTDLGAVSHTSYYEYYNNIFDFGDVPGGYLYSLFYATESFNADLTNNIIIRPTGSYMPFPSWPGNLTVCGGGRLPKKMTWRNNLFTGDADPNDITPGYNCESEQYEIVIPSDANNQYNKTPTFYGSGALPSPYYRPESSTSDQVDKGMNYGDDTGGDYDECRVPQGTTTDIGSFEYGGDCEIPDVAPPYTYNKTPSPGQTNVLKGSNITLYVADFVSTVDTSEIVMGVEGTDYCCPDDTTNCTSANRILVCSGTNPVYVSFDNRGQDYDYEQVVNVTFDACDNAGTPNCMTQESWSFTVEVLPPGIPNITTDSLPNAIKDSAYSAYLNGEKGIPPYSWTVLSGTLPTGLSLNSSTGEISGTSTATGSETFTIRLTDSVLSVADKQFSITTVLSGALWDISDAFTGGYDDSLWHEFTSGTGGAGTIKTDYFTSANAPSDEQLSDHTSNVGGGWTAGASIHIDGVTGRVELSTSYGTFAYKTETLSSANYFVEGTGKIDGDATENRIGVVGRYDPVTGDYYFLRIYGSTSGYGFVNLTKRVDSVSTQLDEYFISGFDDQNDYVLKLEMDGSSIKGYLDGTERVSATDSDITAAGKVGIYLRGNGSMDSMHSEYLAGTSVNCAESNNQIECTAASGTGNAGLVTEQDYDVAAPVKVELNVTKNENKTGVYLSPTLVLTSDPADESNWVWFGNIDGTTAAIYQRLNSGTPTLLCSDAGGTGTYQLEIASSSPVLRLIKDGSPVCQYSTWDLATSNVFIYASAEISAGAADDEGDFDDFHAYQVSVAAPGAPVWRGQVWKGQVFK